MPDVINKLLHAQTRWQSLSVAQRTSRFNALADRLESEKTHYAKRIAQDMGKPVAQGVKEIEKCAALCRYYATESAVLLQPERLPKGTIVYEPLGLILGIMPWNYPFWQVMRFTIPTVATGNVVLIKHAPNVDHCVATLNDLFTQAELDQVLQVVQMEIDQTSKLIADPRVAGVSLTGSVRAGRSVAEIAGKHLKRTVIELGGSDPFIVTESALLSETIEAGVTSRFNNAGQVCVAAKRFIVHESVWDAFCSGFINETKKYRLGDPLDPATTMGPLARADLKETLTQQVNISVQQGAQILYQGSAPTTGHFYPPTILSHTTATMPVRCEETFGPVAVLIPYSTPEEAITIANETHYGLGASVWTQNPDQATWFAQHIQAGTVFINQPVGSIIELPFGGTKQSGYGRELGKAGLVAFTNPKTVVGLI